MTARIAPRDDLRALDGYHSPQVEVATRLNTNESPFAPPAGFVARYQDALGAIDFHRYPDRAATELRAALGAFLGQPPARLCCANGSNEVLQTILLTYGGPGRRALVFEPTYALHSHIARITGTDVVAGERGPDFTVDPARAVEQIQSAEPSVVLLCTPNNPTGTVESPEAVAALAAATADAGALLVVDEAYGEFAPWSALALVDDERPLAVVRTYSKVWSLAAVRLGFAVAPPWVVQDLERVMLPYALSVPTQLAGRLALDYRADMERRVAQLVEERGRLSEGLRALPGLVVYPSGANFVLFRIDGDDGRAARRLWEKLLGAGVLVRDFSQWPLVEGCLRVTVGTPAENDVFLAAIGELSSEVVT